MKDANEVIMLFLNLIAFIFILSYNNEIKQVNAYKILYASFLFFLFASICTNLESFFWGETLNVFEHLSYAISVVLMSVWSYKFLLSNKNIIKHD
jgi:hypothetical protein